MSKTTARIIKRVLKLTENDAAHSELEVLASSLGHHSEPMADAGSVRVYAPTNECEPYYKMKHWSVSSRSGPSIILVRKASAQASDEPRQHPHMSWQRRSWAAKQDNPLGEGSGEAGYDLPYLSSLNDLGSAKGMRGRSDDVPAWSGSVTANGSVFHIQVSKAGREDQRTDFTTAQPAPVMQPIYTISIQPDEPQAEAQTSTANSERQALEFINQALLTMSSYDEQLAGDHPLDESDDCCCSAEKIREMMASTGLRGINIGDEGDRFCATGVGAKHLARRLSSAVKATFPGHKFRVNTDQDAFRPERFGKAPSTIFLIVWKKADGQKLGERGGSLPPDENSPEFKEAIAFINTLGRLPQGSRIGDSLVRFGYAEKGKDGNLYLTTLGEMSLNIDDEDEVSGATTVSVREAAPFRPFRKTAPFRPFRKQIEPDMETLLSLVTDKEDEEKPPYDERFAGDHPLDEDAPTPMSKGDKSVLAAMVDPIKDEISKIFPKAYLNVYAEGNLMDSLTVKFSVEPRSEWPSGIFQNAKYIVLHVEEKDRRYETGFGPYVAESISEYLPIHFNKKTGTKEQVIKHISRFFQKLLDLQPAQRPIQEATSYEDINLWISAEPNSPSIGEVEFDKRGERENEYQWLIEFPQVRPDVKVGVTGPWLSEDEAIDAAVEAVYHADIDNGVQDYKINRSGAAALEITNPFNWQSKDTQ